MSVYYDLYASGNPQKKEEQQPLHARVIPSGTLDAKKFIELVSKSNGFSQATIEGCLQAVTDELQHWLKQGWIVEVGELGHFSLSLIPWSEKSFLSACTTPENIYLVCSFHIQRPVSATE